MSFDPATASGGYSFEEFGVCWRIGSRYWAHFGAGSSKFPSASTTPDGWMIPISISTTTFIGPPCRHRAGRWTAPDGG